MLGSWSRAVTSSNSNHSSICHLPTRLYELHYALLCIYNLLNSLEIGEAKQGVVGDGLNAVPLQVDVGQVLHAPDGPWDPAEVVLEAEQLLERRLLDEDAVGDVEEVAVRQIQAHQLLQAREGPRVQVADVLVVRHLQVHQVGEALQHRHGRGIALNEKYYRIQIYKILLYTKTKVALVSFVLLMFF